MKLIHIINDLCKDSDEPINELIDMLNYDVQVEPYGESVRSVDYVSEINYGNKKIILRLRP